MRLNDPQIELVHDDPFMGYIETARAGTSGVPHTSTATKPALLDIAEEEEAATTAPASTADDDEDVDVGDNSRPIPDQPPCPRNTSGDHDRVIVSVGNNRENGDDAASAAGADQSIVIVLLVE